MMLSRLGSVRALVALAVLVAGLASGGLDPAAAGEAAGDGSGGYVSARPGFGRFPLVAAGRAARLVVDGADYPGVVRAVDDLQADIGRVTGVSPEVTTGAVPPGAAMVVLVGTIGHSKLIDDLVAAGKLDVAASRASGRPRCSRWSGARCPVWIVRS